MGCHVTLAGPGQLRMPTEQLASRARPTKQATLHRQLCLCLQSSVHERAQLRRALRIQAQALGTRPPPCASALGKQCTPKSAAMRARGRRRWSASLAARAPFPNSTRAGSRKCRSLRCTSSRRADGVQRLPPGQAPAVQRRPCLVATLHTPVPALVLCCLTAPLCMAV